MNRSRKACLGAILGCFMVLAAIFGWPGAKVSTAQIPSTGGDWQQVSNVPADMDFRSVFMSSVTSGVAVGKQGDKGVAYMLQWSGAGDSRMSLQLTPIAFDFRAPLWSAVLVNGHFWAVGEHGLIVHGHEEEWGVVPIPISALDTQLLTLQMLGDGEEGWAGGFLPRAGGGRPEPVLLHYIHGQWQREESVKGEGSINALHFAADGGWAVGDAGIWRYQKGAWTREQEPNPCPQAGCFPTYSAVRVISGDEAWIAGNSMGMCGICVPQPYVLHREGGNWQIVVNGNVQGDPTRPGAGRELHGLSFSNSGASPGSLAWAVGTIRDNFQLKPYILAHRGNQTPSEWQYVPASANVDTQLTSVSQPDGDHAVAVGTNGVILSFGYGPQASPTAVPTTVGSPTPAATPAGSNPTQRVADPHNPNVTYFPAVGHTLGGVFRDYWQQHGGLAQFGYPLTEEFTETSATDGKPYVTQYFERARFELHPENKPPYNVLLGLLGRTVTAGRENEAPFRRTAQAGPGTLYFDATGHNIAPQFSAYWQQHGGLPVYGYPISEPFTEVSPTDGKPYLVQYFERNRLEYHPELPEAFKVSLGLLGAQVLQQRGWIR